jgi:hypothetical protein
VLIGAVLFAAQRMLHPQASAASPLNTIVLTQDDLRQMSVTWLAQGRPPLTAEEWHSLIEAKIREEVLYREALALGLETDDTIVKRRMVQKMEFLAEDVAASREPTEEELQAWFDKDSSRFAVPPRTTFRHLYFGIDRRGTHAKEAAEAAMERIRPLSEDAAVALKPADAFMFQDVYTDRTPDHIAKDFGPAFARALFELPVGVWSGPIESGYGWHLIFVESREPQRIPIYEEVATDVRTQWIGDQSAAAKRSAYERMRKKYTVVLPAPPTDTANGATQSQTPAAEPAPS